MADFGRRVSSVRRALASPDAQGFETFHNVLVFDGEGEDWVRFDHEWEALRLDLATAVDFRILDRRHGA